MTDLFSNTDTVQSVFFVNHEKMNDKSDKKNSLMVIVWTELDQRIREGAMEQKLRKINILPFASIYLRMI